MPYPSSYKCEDCDFHELADAEGEAAKAAHDAAHPDHAVRHTNCVPPPEAD